MAGHSKWANTQWRKGRQDAKRTKIFTKVIREVTLAARSGGDPASNSRLRLAMDRAFAVNMSRDTVERAVRRGSGELGAEQVHEMRYEGYGPGGVAIMLDCLTDNRTRTVAEVRFAFSRNGGNLGADGSVAYLFDKRSVIAFETTVAEEEERILGIALEAGADDVVSQDGWVEVLGAPEAHGTIRDALQAAGLMPVAADVTMRPAVTIAVAGETATALVGLLEALEDLDDVQHVYSNADFPADLMDAA